MRQITVTMIPTRRDSAAARAVVAVLGLTLLLGLPLALAACASQKQGAYATAPASIEPNGPISWGEARSRIGERLTAEGPVASVQEAGGEVVLNLGADAPDPSRLVVIIPAAVRDKFPTDAIAAYQGELVRVTGAIENRAGVATIVVTQPTELRKGL
jgi:hypothetical protein